MACERLCEIRGVLERIAESIQGNDPAHGWPHTLRVRKLAREIIENENISVDECVLDAAIILHDVGRGLPGEENHAVKSARLARDLLSAMSVPEECVEGVEHAILAHSYSLGIAPETLEAVVLSDADKLDALGSIGIARVFHTGCQLGRSFDDSIRHIRVKLLSLPERIKLGYARRLAVKRLGIVRVFLDNWC